MSNEITNDQVLAMPSLLGNFVGIGARSAADMLRALAAEREQSTCSLREALNVIEHWGRRGNTLQGDDVARLRALTDAIAPREQSTANQHTLSDFINLPDAERVAVGQKVAERVDQMREQSPAVTDEVVAWRWRDDVRPGLPWRATTDAGVVGQLREAGGYEIESLAIAPLLQSPAVDFDTWQKNPYTKVLQKSIAEDYVPAVDHARVPDGWLLMPPHLTRDMERVITNEGCVYSSASLLYEALLAASPTPGESHD